MLPYVIVFFISTSISYVSELCFKKEKNKLGLLILILAMIPLVVLATVREPSLGYDMELYGKRTFNLASKLSYISYKNYAANSYTETGFLWIVYCLIQIKPDINFMMFGLQMINTIAFVIFAYSQRKKCSVTLINLLYETTWYLMTFNIMKQSITLALVLIMILLFEKKKYISTGVLFFFRNFLS